MFGVAIAFVSRSGARCAHARAGAGAVATKTSPIRRWTRHTRFAGAGTSAQSAHAPLVPEFASIDNCWWIREATLIPQAPGSAWQEGLREDWRPGNRLPTDVPAAMVAVFGGLAATWAIVCSGFECRDRGAAGQPSSAALIVVNMSLAVIDLRVGLEDRPIAQCVFGHLCPANRCLRGSPSIQRVRRHSRFGRSMKFTFRQLTYFIAAAESGSITLASKRANISQPAISTAISHIESELDVQLFLRHHAQGLSLTPAGRALLREAKQLLKQANGLYSAAADISHQMRGELSVGWFSTLAPIVMPEMVQSFLKAFPETQIRLVESHQEDLISSLRAAEIEVAITYDLQISEDVAFLPLATLPPYALFGASHPLARERSVRLSRRPCHGAPRACR